MHDPDPIAPASAPLNAPVDQTQALANTPNASSQPLPRWTIVGRYALLAPIAQGGMGVVYKAYDPELARFVAIKLLRPDRMGDRDTSADLQTRLLQREAQALARVAHPNVIAVHDVGTWNGLVFVAMELVDGTTLGDFLAEQRRSTNEILTLFVAAGQGLVAAHAAGLIHRDFKPSNVLVGADGRVRVLDFGLARSSEHTVRDGDDKPSMGSGIASASPIANADPSTRLSVQPPIHASTSPTGSQASVATSDPEAQASVPPAVSVTLPPETVRAIERAFADELSRGSARVVGRSPSTREGSSRKSLTQEHSPASFSSRDLLESPLTVFGQVVGTPAYMAPEQQRGESVDARTDQFSFCVALYEALYGERPYPAKAFVHVRKIPTKPDYPARRRRVPNRVKRALARGLEGNPADRFGSMEALLAELRAAIGQGRRRAIAVVTTAVVAGFGVWIPMSRADDPAALCMRSVDSITRAWNDAAKSALQTAFLATKLPYAADTFSRVAEVLDRYGSEWKTMRGETCQATYVLGSQSPELLDRRMACLDRNLGELGALAKILAQSPDATTIDKAVSAAYSLPALTTCADSERLLAAYPLPEPTLAPTVATANALLDEAEAMRLAGRMKPALERARKALAQVQELGYPPVVARAHYIVGTLESDSDEHEAARKSLSRAAEKAAEARDDVLVASAWAQLLQVVGVDQAHPEQTEFIVQAVNQWIERANKPPRVQATALETMGHIAFWRGDFVQAEKQYRALADQIRANMGERDPLLPTALNSIGAAVASRGDYAGASKVFQEALDRGSEVLGPQHPWVALVTTNLALLHHRMGNNVQARALLVRALAVYESVYGEQHSRVALCLNNLAAIESSLGNGDAAEAASRRAVAIIEAIDGREHPNLANPLQSLAGQLAAHSRWDEARTLLDRVVAIRRNNGGAEPHPDIAYPLQSLGDIHQWKGDLDEAERLYREALEIRSKGQGHTPELLGALYSSLASVRLERGDIADAERLEAEARKIVIDGLGSDHWNVEQTDTLLAEIRVRQGRADEAVALLRKIETKRASQFSDNDHQLAGTRLALGRALLAQRNFAEALTTLQKAKALPEPSPAFPRVELGIGHALVELERPREAIVELEHALERARVLELNPAMQAEVSFMLARALWDANADRERARMLASEALQLTAKAQSPRLDVPAVRAWLATHVR